MAGFHHQRLAVLATYRDEELAIGHPMHSWLADLRRLPSVSEVRLDRLTRDETEQQLAMLLGGDPRDRLVDDVVRRSDGNPYLTELLVRGVTVTADELPADLPAELSEALLAAWHGLSAPARDVMRVLAVAGRPTPIDDLREVAATRGIGPEQLSAALAEASNAGICVRQAPDRCWFRHPLLAEVLYVTFVPGEAEPVHAAWAKVLESRSGTGLDEIRRHSDLALHYEGARDLTRCLDASLKAADLAEAIKAPREEAVHLRRAALLWPRVHTSGGAEAHRELDLLERLGRAAYLVGDGEVSFHAWRRARELVDDRVDPLHASRLQRRWADSFWATGRIAGAGQPIAEASRAVELSEAFPDSEEYAEALACLSWRQIWNNELGPARKSAEEAVHTANRSASVRALSLAYAARGCANLRDERSDRDTSEALRFARLTGDPELIWRAVLSRDTYLVQRGRLTECVEMTADFLPFALDLGALSVAVFTAGVLAHDLLILGRFSESADVIREGLSFAGLPIAHAKVRLSAATLALRRGNPEVAAMHLQRAAELIPGLEIRPGLAAPAVLAEYLLMTGQSERALDLSRRLIGQLAEFADPSEVDETLMWGARAAANLAESARDRRDSEGVRDARVQFDDLVSLRRSLLPPPFEVITHEDLIQPAMRALFTAEEARCRSETGTSGVWSEAVDRCHTAGMRWEEAVASWRLAQALLDERAARALIAVPLRSVYRFAVEVGSLPLRREAETLATLGKIPLDEPTVRPPDQPPPPFRSLTTREQEVLAHLVSGRTYAEIAAALFISEKTVSVHVSNLLRKTGTSSRREVSALAVRLGQSSGGDA